MSRKLGESMDWFTGNVATFVVALLLLLVVIAVIRALRKSAKEAKSRGTCAGCSQCCPGREPTDGNTCCDYPPIDPSRRSPRD